MSIIISLTDEQEKIALDIAKQRNLSQRKANRRDGKVLNDSVGIDIDGALAEKAVSVAFNLPWDGDIRSIKEWFVWRNEGHDVSGLEVRSTKHKNGCLLVHPSDKDESPFVLVLTDKRSYYTIVGWAYGNECKQDILWRDVGYGRPCYFYPQHLLRDINSLADIINLPQ